MVNWLLLRHRADENALWLLETRVISIASRTHANSFRVLYTWPIRWPRPTWPIKTLERSSRAGGQIQFLTHPRATPNHARPQANSVTGLLFLNNTFPSPKFVFGRRIFEAVRNKLGYFGPKGFETS